MEGLVIGLQCGTYSVFADGVIYRVPARGIFRKDNLKVTVGDYVILDEKLLIISSLVARKSLLIRPNIANIDQALVVLSLKEPEFSYHLAFKYLTYTSMNNLPSYLIVSKVDDKKDEDFAFKIKDVFESVGIKTFLVSSKNKLNIEQVTKLFNKNITCLIGQSGVGKSSLLNAIDENYQREIGEYSTALGRGKHKTKEVVLLPYQGGYIADTPGFSSLDLKLRKEDLAKFFPGFSELALKCFFSNCLHLSEKKCKIKEAVENHEIPSIAYEIYQKLLEESE